MSATRRSERLTEPISSTHRRRVLMGRFRLSSSDMALPSHQTVILSGAEIPGVGKFTVPRGSPPLLATQGTADTINPPSSTNVFFDTAQRPKYLLSLIGAEHLPPYSDQQPQLAIVERVSIAFFDGYLKHRHEALKRLNSLGSVPGTASMVAEP